MKTATLASPIIASPELKSSIMGMDAKGMDLATYFMRDKIYSDKILAVTREYICNALDEHQKYNIDAPVSTGIRHVGTEKEFFVRDYAKGLSEYQVRNIFGMYFRSTKSNANDSIGGFGIGSKAGHCYTDSFNVVSYHRGIKSTYICTLGGGDNGVPVGQIFKIDEETTEESGIEINLLIKPSDYSDFVRSLDFICAYIDKPIEVTILDAKRKYCEPVWKSRDNEIGFRLYKQISYNCNQSIIIQMGGITYEHDTVKEKYVSVIPDHVLVVDIPIGKMSLPISREKFENTATNQKYRELINGSISKLIEADLSHFRNSDIKQAVYHIVDNDLAPLFCAGKVFRIKHLALYPEYHIMLSSIRKFNKSAPAYIKNNKPVLLTVPNNRMSDYWFDKVQQFCNKNNLSCLTCKHDSIPEDQTELKKYFNVISARTIKSTQQKDHERFSVYRGSYNLGLLNALELHNHIRSSLGLETADSEDQARKQNEKFYEECNNIDQLEAAILKSSKQVYQNYYVGSFKLKKNAEQIGIFHDLHPQVVALRKKLSERRNEQVKIQAEVSKAKNDNWPKSPRTQKLIENYKNAVRWNKMVLKLKSEKSLRGKVISSIDKANCNSWSKILFSRQEVREILKQIR